MAVFKCKNCGKEEEIKFGVVGHGLIDMTINFKCKGCDCSGVLYVQFKKGKDQTVKVTLEKPDYFG